LSKQNWYLAILLSILILGGIASWLFFRNRQHQQKKKLQQTIMEQQDLATKAVLQAEENERQRIAADLHDGVGQMLTAVRLNLQGLQDRIQLNKEEDRLIYEKVLCMMDESSKEVRTVSHTIMPNALIKTGLGNAIKDFVEKIENNQILIQLHTQGLNDKLETHIEIVVYRIVQECVKNVIKHSKANKLDISIIRDDDGLRVTVEDNGTGFNKSELEKKSGIGMKNIRARVEYLKGSLDVDTQPGKGTLVAFFIPTH
jgi:signal transduction histidine kinase